MAESTSITSCFRKRIRIDWIWSIGIIGWAWCKRRWHRIQIFKLKIQGEEFKGTFNNGKVEWFNPKPTLKLKDERVEKIEKKVQEKIEEQLD